MIILYLYVEKVVVDIQSKNDVVKNGMDDDSKRYESCVYIVNGTFCKCICTVTFLLYIHIYVKMKIDFDMYSYIYHIFVIYKMIGNILCIVRIYIHDQNKYYI